MILYIETYTAFRSKSHLYIKGRILRKSPIVSKKVGPILSLYYTALRAWTREVSDVKITVSYGQKQYKLKSDHEGYFELLTKVGETDSKNSQLDILCNEYSQSIDLDITYVLKPIKTVIVSDIDDTIMVTGVTSFFKLKLLWNTLFLNPFRRIPIENASNYFQFLSTNDSQFIYLSNSPWNLFHYLKSFLSHNNFPEGFIILRDMGWQLIKSRSIENRNKFIEIEKLIQIFSSSSFILIGDTGEKDFFIYQALQKKYPNKVAKIIMNAVGNIENEKLIEVSSVSNKTIKLVKGYSDI